MASGSKKVIYAALIGNGLIAVTKFIASAVTGSSAMFSEGIHSVVDTGNQVLLLFGLKRAAKPPDDRFPFGHGKEIYFWSFVVAIMIFAVGSGISLYEGIQHIRDPHPIDNPTINYIVLGLSMLFEGVAWTLAYREFSHIRGSRSILREVHESKDPTTYVVLFEDTAAMLGLVVAFVGVWLAHTTGMAWLDGAASVVIGLILGATAFWLAWETKSLLIGESAKPEVVEGVRELAQDVSDIERVGEVLTLHMGPEYILVNLSVDFRDDCSAGNMEASIAALSGAIKGRWPRVKKVFVEAETLRPGDALPAKSQ